MTNPHEERPVDLSEVPEGEDVEVADAAEELDRDPDEQRNRTDPEQPDAQDHPGHEGGAARDGAAG